MNNYRVLETALKRYGFQLVSHQGIRRTWRWTGTSEAGSTFTVSVHLPTYSYFNDVQQVVRAIFTVARVVRDGAYTQDDLIDRFTESPEQRAERLTKIKVPRDRAQVIRKALGR